MGVSCDKRAVKSVVLHFTASLLTPLLHDSITFPLDQKLNIQFDVLCMYCRICFFPMTLKLLVLIKR